VKCVGGLGVETLQSDFPECGSRVVELNSRRVSYAALSEWRGGGGGGGGGSGGGGHGRSGSDGEWVSGSVGESEVVRKAYSSRTLIAVIVVVIERQKGGGMRIDSLSASSYIALVGSCPALAVASGNGNQMNSG
jgi:hypothetical protein